MQIIFLFYGAPYETIFFMKYFLQILVAEEIFQMIGYLVYLSYAEPVNTERYVWHSRLACAFHSSSNAGQIKDMFSLYRHSSEIQLPRFIWHRITISFDSSCITFTIVDDMYPDFVPLDSCRFTSDRPIQRYCKTKMKCLRLSFYSMNCQGCYLRYPNDAILVLLHYYSSSAFLLHFNAIIYIYTEKI